MPIHHKLIATLIAANWRQVGSQLGSNLGGKFQAPDGQLYYVKFSPTAAHAHNEVLANRLYQAARAPVITNHLVNINNKLGVASRWHNIERNIDPNDLADRAEAAKHFATHAWLSNWDAAGLDYDNQAKINNKLHTVDVGGALQFRAQGAPKGAVFGNKADEWHSLRNPNINYQNAHIFSNLTPEQLRASAKRVIDVPDNHIHALVNKYGYGSVKDKLNLADKLIARKQDIMNKANALPT